MSHRKYLAVLLLSASLAQADYYFQTLTKAPTVGGEGKGGIGYIVDKKDFPVLDGVTCYTIEVFNESMRLPHWHPNAAELGYVVSGTIEVVLWRSPGETAVFRTGPGMCWFIPQGALHLLNCISEEKATLLVGFSSDTPGNVDLPVAFNGIPAPVKNAYTSPHEDLKKWTGPIDNIYFGKSPYDPAIPNLALSGSPYNFDLAQVTPLFNQSALGSVVWGVKDNWPILDNLSILRVRMKPQTARDPLWWPDAGTLYIVTQGKGQFYITHPGQKTVPVDVERFDYIFVPVGTLHTFLNTADEDFEVIALFNRANPLPEVSLSVATAFFPPDLRKAALTQYATVQKRGDPLKILKYTTVSPYILPLKEN